MSGWFKRFFLSLFSAECAKENIRYGFGNILLTCLLSVVFVFLGIFAGGTLPFSAYYKSADEFRGFLYNAFIESGSGITVTADGDGAEITADGGDVLINTFTDDGDRAKYTLGGYHLIIDSRAVASVYDDFTAYCVSSDGQREISYGDYLNLSEKEKRDYVFSVEYSGEQKIVTEEDILIYTAYFDAASDASAEKEYGALAEQKGELSVEEFNNSLYALYVRYYYPDMLSTVGERVPTLRNYYYRLTRQSQGKYFCMFGDMLTASFCSYNKNTVAFGGVYRPGNGLDVAGLDGGNARSAVDKFIKDVYYGGLSTAFIFELLNPIFLIVAVELITVGVMLLCYAVCKLKKSDLCPTFAKSAKLVASYAHTAAFFASLFALCTGFVFVGAVKAAAYVVFGAVMVARTLTLTLVKKQSE